MDHIPVRPRDELLMALAGPAVSVLLGLVCAAYVFLRVVRLAFMPGFAGADEAEAAMLRAVFSHPNVDVLALGTINLILAVFNLLPAFPMDGGRVFRALLAPRLGRVRATYFAACLGEALAFGMGVLGYRGIRSLGWHGNPMLIVIAIFIFFAARREYRVVREQEAARWLDEWPANRGDHEEDSGSA